VAWSPDGTALATVRPEGISILELSSGIERILPAPGALSVDWAPATNLLAVERGPEGSRVVSIDPATGARSPLHVAPELRCARWLGSGAGWFAVTAAFEVGRIGTRSSRTVIADLGVGAREVHRFDQTYPTQEPLADPSLGWGAARENPLHHGLLLPEVRKAPLFGPQLRLVPLDPFDPGKSEQDPIGVAGFGAEASWSPDGGRAAVVDAAGAMRVLEPGKRAPDPVGAPRGTHPSWHPSAEVIFLGGWLVTPSGAPLRKLVAGGEEAVGVWSPRGDRIAVAGGGRVLVFGELGLPAPPPTDARLDGVRAATWKLGTLRREGLLAPEPYREARDRLRSQRLEER
jgi:hypothetical protein